MAAKYALSDIDVNEVSAVDRAANKRRFIIAKAETMPGDEQKNNEAAGAAGTTDEQKNAGAEGAAADPGASGSASSGDAAAAASGTEKGTDGASADAGQGNAPGQQSAGTDGAAAPQGTTKADGAAADPGAAGDAAGAPAGAMGAPVHAALLAEKKASLVNAANALLESVDALDITEALSALDAMSTLVWRMRDDFAVVALAKSEDGPARDGVVADLQKAHARIVAKKALVEAKKAAGDTGGSAVAPTAKAAAATEPGQASDVMVAARVIERCLGAIQKSLEQIVTDVVQKAAPAPAPQQTDKAAPPAPAATVAKAEDVEALRTALADVTKRLATIEKSTPEPQSREGDGRLPAKKSESAWPADMAQDIPKR